MRWGAAAVATIAVVLVDRFTKMWAEATLPDAPITIIDGWLAFQYAENPGAAFGIFRDLGPVLAVLAMAALVLIVVMIGRSQRVWEAVALGMIGGGAIGNLIDRLARGDGLADGHVVDFIRVPLIPNFNVADAALTVGVGILLVMSLIHRDAEDTVHGVAGDAR